MMCLKIFNRFVCQARSLGMTLAKRIGGVAIAALIAIASLVPTSADARGGRFAAGAFAGFAAGALVGAAIGGWGPYPYYYGYYPAPVYYPPGPYYGPFGDYGYGGCGIRTVWTGRHWRHVRVCY
jgi:hypothetical protein